MVHQMYNIQKCTGTIWAYLMNKFNGDHINAIAGHKSGVNRKKLNTADSYNEIRHELPSENREYLKRIA